MKKYSNATLREACSGNFGYCKESLNGGGDIECKNSVETMKCGAEEYLEKPFDINQLMEESCKATNAILVLRENPKQGRQSKGITKSW